MEMRQKIWKFFRFLFEITLQSNVAHFALSLDIKQKKLSKYPPQKSWHTNIAFAKLRGYDISKLKRRWIKWGYLIIYLKQF